MKIMVKSAWGSDDPTQAAFPFLHSNALAEAGHEVQIFLLGEAVWLMRDVVASNIVPVGWPPVNGNHADYPNAWHPDLCLRRVLQSTRDCGCGFGGEKRGFWKPDHSGAIDRVGG